MFKFVICATLVSKTCYLHHYIHSAQNDIFCRKGKEYAVVSWGGVCDYCANL